MSNITPEHTELLMRAAEAVGEDFARSRPYVEAEDVTSEVMTQALEEWSYISSRLEKVKDYGQTEYNVLRYFLAQRANKFCEKQKYEYTMRTAQVIYTPKEVRALLKEYFYNPSVYDTPDLDEHYGATVEAKSVWVNLLDLKEALNRVTPKVYNTILAAFGPEDLGLPEPHAVAVTRAVDAVTEQLNRRVNRRADDTEYTNTNEEIAA